MRNLMNALFAALVAVQFAAVANADTGVEMLPDGGSYNENVPQPKEIFGFEVGQQHVRHDQLVNYFRALAQSSDRVKLETTGRTHEGREQLLAIISSPENIRNIEQIRERHLAVARGEREPGDAPVILWQGYSIHGDESSGSNAVPLYAWHLAASNDADVMKMLEDVVVLIDPSLNPDGMARFAAWATSRRGETVVTDPAHQEHNQPWPSGRGNHYWFDLNRDWLLLQHPESRNRVDVLTRWRPHIVTDHHEMGSDSTFFFQPGVQDRTHPLTPKRNQELTAKIAEFHGKRLDEIGRLYYTEESFDDFYYGKGSTYPDITGGIGILFEQATTEGQAIETPFGVRPFWKSVHNQLTTSLSTLEAAYALRDPLREYQANFFEQARENTDGAWVIGNGGNPARMNAFLELLAGHDVRFAPLEERVRENGETFTPGNAWVVPMNQPQSRLIEAMFDVRTEFTSKTFYDVSTWTLPLAFDLPYARVSGVPDIGKLQHEAPGATKAFAAAGDAVAYAFEWQSDAAPAALQELLENDVRVLAATKSLTVNTANGAVKLAPGSMLVPLGVQDVVASSIAAMLEEAANDGVTVHTVRGGLTAEGVDLGSPSLVPLEPVKPLLVIGDGLSPYEAGEFWHFADTRLGLPVTQVEREKFGRVNLDDYTHVILVHGYGGGWNEADAKRLHEWMNDGGVLIAQQKAADWATDYRLYLASGERRDALEEAGDDFGKAADEKREADAKQRDKSKGRTAYAEFEEDYAETLVSGSIFMTDADLTHPLAYGLPDENVPVFKDRSETLSVSSNPYSTVLQFVQQPLVSGYASAERREEIAGTGALLADRVGRGMLVRMAFDPLFRGYWHGTQRLMANSLYLAQTVGRTELN